MGGNNMENLIQGYISIIGKALILKPNLTLFEFKVSDLYNDVVNARVGLFCNYYIKPQYKVYKQAQIDSDVEDLTKENL